VPANQVREEKESMVKGSATPSDGSPATAGGSPLAGPGSTDQRTVQFDDAGQDQGSKSGEASEGEYEEKAWNAE
ncbi:hypothetical protein PC113_g14176, partial [Phytophthora cactorum]